MTAAHTRGPPAIPLPSKHGCTGKIAFNSRSDARKATQSRGGETYLCPHCNGWHHSRRGKVKTSIKE